MTTDSVSNPGIQVQSSGRSFPETYRLIAKILTALTVMCSVLVLVDRLVFFSYFHKILPSHWPMKTNAALGLLISGVALWLRQTQPRESRIGKLSRYFGIVIFGLGIVTLYEYIFSVELGFDRILFELMRTVDYFPVYDRMAPLAAINFLLMGVILFLYEVETPRVILVVQILTFFLFFTSLVGIFSHVYVLPNWFGPNPNFLSIALFAAILFTFLALSVLFSRPDKGFMVLFSDDGIGGSLARWLTVFSIIVPSILDLMTMWGERTGFLGDNSKSVIDISAIILVFTFVVYQASNWVSRLDGERRKAEEVLRKTVHELERSNADLEQFAYVASHDLQEPLRMIGSYVQLLQRRYKGKLDSDADDFIEYAVNGAKRMRNLINDLLAYSRVVRRRKDFEPTSFEEILKQVEADLRLAVQASGGSITHEPLPTINADPVQIAQVLQNLIGNALKFHGDRPPKVHIEAKKENAEWVFSVRDNGIGFEAQYADRIFVIFQRLQGGEKYPGTGIGLAICKKIMERHGGRIWAESTPGEGSVFHFAIPAI
ncbi:MAG: hypothetical protein HQM09_04965 [Candidatus Riflebacteria bacterium]|nr:hypothetical protein [Candidatus Riflebacteria bacterium]